MMPVGQKQQMVVSTADGHVVVGRARLLAPAGPALGSGVAGGSVEVTPVPPGSRLHRAVKGKKVVGRGRSSLLPSLSPPAFHV